MTKEYHSVSERMELLRWWDYLAPAVEVFIGLVLISELGFVGVSTATFIFLFAITELQRKYYMRHRDHLLEVQAERTQP